MSLKTNLLKAADKTMNFASKNAPALLTAACVASTIGAVVTAVTGTIKAVEAVEADKDEFRDEIDEQVKEEVANGDVENTPEAMSARMEEILEEEYTWKDVLACTWHYYIPTACFAVMGIGCAIGSQSINTRRQAATFALYEAAQNTLKTYQEKVIDEVGKNKEKKIRHAVHEEEIRRRPPREDNVYNCNRGRCGVENGEALFREPVTGQYFVSTYEKVRRAIRKANDACHQDTWYPLSELLDDMGADPTATGIYNKGFLGTPDPAQNAIDEDYLLDPHTGEYMNHEVTIVYITYDISDRDYL